MDGQRDFSRHVCPKFLAYWWAYLLQVWGLEVVEFVVPFSVLLILLGRGWKFLGLDPKTGVPESGKISDGNPLLRCCPQSGGVTPRKTWVRLLEFEVHVLSVPDVSRERRCLQTSPEQLKTKSRKFCSTGGSGVSWSVGQKSKHCKNTEVPHLGISPSGLSAPNRAI